MRALILFSILVAGVFARSHTDRKYQFDDDWAELSNSDQPEQGPPAGLSPEILGSLVRQQQEEQQQESNSDFSSSPFGALATYPDAAPFYAKIRGRLDSSGMKQAVRQKLMEIADEKFNQCKGKFDNAERACLGRATGQVMQLAAAVENMSRNQH